MNNQDLLRVVDHISREKNIDKFLVFEDLEMAMLSAARKAYGATEDISVKIDRMNGDIDATLNGEPISMKDLGRIAAQTAKQVMIQKIREAERDSIFEEFAERVGQIVTGTVSRIERGAISVNLGRAEGFLPRSEQIPGETHHPGERIRAMILDVREMPHEVRIVLTRTHPDYIRRLFDLEVPEVGEKIIEIKALAREAGYRTKIAVTSIDAKVDAVGACVGVRGSRIRNIVDELGGEKIDIVRWNESSQVLITNALKPAEVQETALCFELGRATVVVAEDQLSLAIGKRGQNVRLAARLTGWDVNIVTPVEYNQSLDDMEKTLREIEGVTDIMLDRLLAMGIISLEDIEEVGAEPLVSELEVEEELANQIVAISAEAAKRLAEEAAAAKELAAAKQAEEEAKAAQEMAAAADALGIGGGSSDADAADGENLDAPSDDAPGVGAEPSGSAETEATESAGLTESGGLTESPADPPADARVPGQELAPGQDLAPGQELAPGRES
jgi:N utilization substance protein A